MRVTWLLLAAAVPAARGFVRRCLSRTGVVGVIGVRRRDRQHPAATELAAEDRPSPPPPSGKGQKGGGGSSSPAAASAEDGILRTLDGAISNPILYLIRDSGLLRALADVAVLWGAPSLLRRYPPALGDLLRLLGMEPPLLDVLAWLVPPSLLSSTSSSSSSLLVDVRHERLAYGDHPSQVVLTVSPATRQPRRRVPSDADAAAAVPVDEGSNKAVIFVHGGAWGSGFPTMYLLAATPFVNRGYTFCVVGYRTYPDAGCLEQAQDVVDAVQRIQKEMVQRRQRHVPPPEHQQQINFTLLAHSSGTHICSLAFANGLFPSTSAAGVVVNRFIGLAGVFDVARHYRYERGRGVARFSPMAPACGGTLPAGGHETSDDKGGEQQQQRRRRRRRLIGRRRGGDVLDAWRRNSPLYNVRTATTKGTAHDPSYSFPDDCLLIHGALDTTCPPEYTQEFGQALRESCRHLVLPGSPSRRVEVEILPTGEHAGMVLELMFGGPTLDLVLGFLNTTATTMAATTSA